MKNNSGRSWVLKSPELSPRFYHELTVSLVKAEHTARLDSLVLLLGDLSPVHRAAISIEGTQVGPPSPQKASQQLLIPGS